MSLKYQHIQLSREFRPHVLQNLKAQVGWLKYMRAKGWEGRSSAMPADAIRGACEDLGVDLNALFVAFHSAQASANDARVTASIVRAPAPLNSPVSANAAPVATIAPAPAPNTPAPEFSPLATIEGEDVQLEAMEGESMSEDEGGAREGEGDEDGAPSFEGRDASELTAEILAPVSAHLTPYLAERLPDVIAPIVRAAIATRPAMIEAPRAIEGEILAPLTPDERAARLVTRETLCRAFGLKKTEGGTAYRHALENVLVPMCDYAGAPLIDPEYVWTASTLAQMGAADMAGLAVWKYGHAGTGKTEGAMQYAARLKRPFVRIAINRTTEPVDLVGQYLPTKDGGVEWRDGPLTRAFRTPYCVLLIDEPTVLRSGSLAVLQTALDTRELHLVSGEVVKAAPGLFIVAADNTAGVGDDSGRYIDTSAVNVALLDRFAFRIECTYLPADRETVMLARRTGLVQDACQIMVAYAELTRRDCSAGKLTIGVTPRRLLSWASAVKHGVGSAAAFASCVISGAAPEDKETLLALETQTLRSAHKTIDGLARGTIAPGAGASAGDASSASDRQGEVREDLAFPDDDTNA